MIVEELIEKNGGAFAMELRLVDQVVRNAHPAIVATRKYGMPFYVLKKNLFYLSTMNDRPRIGVVYGVHLETISSLLDFTKRTQIGHYFLDNLSEEGYAELVTIIDAAIAYDLRR